MDGFDGGQSRSGAGDFKGRLGRPLLPGPRVAEPKVGQEVQGLLLRAAVRGLDADADFLRGTLRVLDGHVEVAVLVKNPGVQKLELRFFPPAPPVFFGQPVVREFGLRILVEGLHVGVGGGIVNVEIIFLDVFAVVALVPRQAEEAFLKEGVPAVPEGQGETETLVVVGNAEDAVLAPAVSPGPGLGVGEIVPGIPVRTVVLAHGAPLPLA